MTVRWLTGDVLDHVQALPDASVDLVACSPPFLQLRDYGGIPGQWGSEPDPAAFLDHLLELVVELRRVLASHGSVAFELGDTYSGSGGAGGDYNAGGLRSGQPKFSQANVRAGKIVDHNSGRRRPSPGWPLAKSLAGSPTLFAWSLAYGRNLLRHPRTATETIRWHRRLMRAGMSDRSAAYWLDAWPWPLEPDFEPWRIRNLIVWARTNPPVGALGDKFRHGATSYITVATMATDRWFDLDAVRDPGSPNTHAKTAKGVQRAASSGKVIAAGRGGNWSTLDNIHKTDGAPPIDYWDDEYDGDITWLIGNAGSSLAHFAMWPARLAERLVLAMCPPQVCRTCGEPRRRLTTASYNDRNGQPRPDLAGQSFVDHANRSTQGRRRRPGAPGGVTRSTELLGWSDCGHNDYRPGHVLDPFAGTGTTLAVADIHGRDATGIDLDPANEALYAPRYAECWRALRPHAGPSPLNEHGQQLDLLQEVTA